MGDYFTRLAERAMRASNLARPLIAPMFASDSARESGSGNSNQADELVFEEQVEAAREPEARLPAPLVKPSSNALVDAEQFVNRPMVSADSWAKKADLSQGSHAIARPSLEGREGNEKMDAKSFEPRGAERLDTEQHPERRSRSDRFAVEAQSTATSKSNPALTLRPMASIRAESENSVAMDRRADEPPSEQARTAINVTIGRIEVRAVTSPAPAPRAVTTRRDSSLSLDEYLKQRDEKKR